MRSLAPILLLAVLLRLPALSARPLWLDEALTATIAAAPDLFATSLADDLHPPLLALLLRPFALLHAPDPLMRLPSLLASVAAVPAAAWAARRWALTDPLPTVAALAAAALPPAVLYAGEARPYALTVLLLTLLLGESAAPRLARWLPLAALCALSQHGSWPVLLAAALAAPAPARRLAGLAALAALLLPTVLLPQLAGERLGDGALGPWMWTTGQLVPFTLRRTVELPGYLLTGTHGRMALLAGVALIGLLRPADGPPKRLLLVPLLTFWIAAGLNLHPYGGVRHLLVLLPSALLVLLPRLRPVAFPLLAAFVLAGLARQPRLPVQDVPALLAAHPDLPVYADASAGPAARWYARGPVTALPWRRPEDLPLPTGTCLFLWTSPRDEAAAAYADRLRGAGWTLSPVIRADGAAARVVRPP